MDAYDAAMRLTGKGLAAFDPAGTLGIFHMMISAKDLAKQSVGDEVTYTGLSTRGDFNISWTATKLDCSRYNSRCNPP